MVLSAYCTLSVSTAIASSGTWCETSAGGFQLISDLPEAEQLELLATLDRFEQLAAPFLPGQALTNRSTLKLVVFSQRKDFLALTGKRQFAGYMQPSLQTNRLLIGPTRSNLNETALHEYAHYLLRNRTGVSLPMWFDEGLATMLGATSFRDDTARLGEIPVSRMERRIARDSELTSPQQRLSRTLEATSMDRWAKGRVDEFYDLAWLLTHYLYFNVYAESNVYAEAMGSGDMQQSELAAFLHDRSQSLPEHLGMRSSQLPRALEKHLDRWDPPEPTPSAVVTLSRTGFRCLSPLQRDLALAMAVHIQNPARARTLLQPHLAQMNSHGDGAEATELPELLLAMARVELASEAPSLAEQYVDQALALNSGNAEAIVLATDLSVRNCLFDRSEDCLNRWQAARGAYRAALRLDPTRYDGILGVGLAELYSGRSGDAVNYLKVAYARAPWAAVINYYLGESYRLMGDSRAATYLENARNWAIQDVWRVLAEESLRLMDDTGANSASE